MKTKLFGALCLLMLTYLANATGPYTAGQLLTAAALNAADANYVHVTGNEVIAGSKRFTGRVVMQNFSGNSTSWVDDTGFSTIMAAATYATANNRALHITKQWTVSNSTDLSALPEIDILPGGSFAVSAGTLTMPANTHTGLAQVYYVTGSGALTGLRYADPEWFGVNTIPGTTDLTVAVNSALASLVPGGVLSISRDILTGYVTSSVASVTIKLNGNTMKTGGLTLAGTSNTLDLGGGVLDGRTKYTTVAGGGGGAYGATSVTVVDASMFSVGDIVQSSYGLGSDGNDPVPITAISGNTITFGQYLPIGSRKRAGAITNIPAYYSQATGLPAGAYIGNWTWGPTLQFTGQNCRAYNGEIHNSGGYAVQVIGVSAIIEKLAIRNNGLDEAYVDGGGTVLFRDCYFGNILDAAKQGLYLTNFSGHLIFDKVIFARNNSDVDLWIDNHSSAPPNIDFLNCTGIGTNNHPYPYDYNATTSVLFSADTGSYSIGTITINGSNYTGYSQYVAMTGNGNTNAFNIKQINFVNSTTDSAFVSIKSAIAAVSASNSKFTSVLSAAYHNYADNAGTRFEYDNCEWVNDTTIKQFFNTHIKNSKFTSSGPLRMKPDSFIESSTLVNSQIVGWTLAGGGGPLRFKDLRIENPGLIVSGSISDAIASGVATQNSMGNFMTTTGTLTATAGVSSYTDFFYYTAESAGQPYFTGLMGTDYYIPAGSVLTSATDGGATKHVNKSNLTTLNQTSVATSTTVSVLSATGIASGDIINIALDDGTVWTTTVVGAPSGTWLTLAAGIPTQATSGRGCCTYTLL